MIHIKELGERHNASQRRHPGMTRTAHAMSYASMLDVHLPFPYAEVALYLAAACSVCTLLCWLTSRSQRLPYPPGPPGWPLLGNLGLPEDPACAVFRSMSDDYGRSLSSSMIAECLLVC